MMLSFWYDREVYILVFFLWFLVFSRTGRRLLIGWRKRPWGSQRRTRSGVEVRRTARGREAPPPGHQSQRATSCAGVNASKSPAPSTSESFSMKMMRATWRTASQETRALRVGCQVWSFCWETCSAPPPGADRALWRSLSIWRCLSSELTKGPRWAWSPCSGGGRRRCSSHCWPQWHGPTWLPPRWWETARRTLWRKEEEPRTERDQIFLQKVWMQSSFCITTTCSPLRVGKRQLGATTRCHKGAKLNIPSCAITTSQTETKALAQQLKTHDQQVGAHSTARSLERVFIFRCVVCEAETSVSAVQHFLYWKLYTTLCMQQI